MTQRYDTYKDSGVQWLGEIPGHWGCVPLKRICEMKSGNNLTSLDILDKGEFPVYGANGFRGYYNQYNKEGKYILIGRQGALAGNVHLVDGKFWATDHAVVTNITSDKVFVDYISLALISMNLNQYAFDTAAQPGLAVSKIISFSTPLPPLSEQHSIVSFLDDKCGKIDKMLEGKQKQIELLAEMKQRIIADAVTHGLNPDVKMKAINIPWLPEIPEHWEMKRSKYLLKLLTESTKRTRKIGLENIESNSGKYILTESIFDGDGVDFDRGDILYGKLRPYLNKVWLAEFDGNAVGDFYVYRAKNGYLNSFAKYLLMSSCFVGISNASTYGAKMPRVSSQFIHSLHFPVPPLSEQRAIVSYLDDKTTKIDTLTSKLQQEIESIKEYKQRLISDVVTGQLKVC